MTDRDVLLKADFCAKFIHIDHDCYMYLFKNDNEILFMNYKKSSNILLNKNSYKTLDVTKNFTTVLNNCILDSLDYSVIKNRTGSNNTPKLDYGILGKIRDLLVLLSQKQETPYTTSAREKIYGIINNYRTTGDIYKIDLLQMNDIYDKLLDIE